MNVGQISYPIKRQDAILFLKLIDVRTSKVEDINLDELKKRVIEQKKMKCLIFILKVIYQNLRIQF